MTVTTFESHLARIDAGEALTPDAIRDLSGVPDIVSLGMLADALRRRLHGGRATFVRVACCPFEKSFSDGVPPAAREVCITGAPDSLEVAVTAVTSARAVAGSRTVSGFSWADIQRLSGTARDAGAVLERLRQAGLDRLAELPLDTTTDVDAALACLRAAGFERIHLTVESGGQASRPELWLRAAALQATIGGIQSINPLPTVLKTFRSTTGYEDVRSVALARLAAPHIPSVQVDWMRYGPKLAQVALTFGADDVWGVSASDLAPEGRRRAPLEEIRRNIEQAGFEAVERDGRFAVA